MAQGEVMRFLEEHPLKWWSSNEISIYLNMKKNAVMVATRKFREYKEVVWKQKRVRCGKIIRKEYVYRYE